jgi:hypothetical protein
MYNLFDVVYDEILVNTYVPILVNIDSDYTLTIDTFIGY